MALPFIAFNVHFGGEFLPATREGRDRAPACLVNVPIPEEFLISGAEPSPLFGNPAIPPRSLWLNHTF
ncbi:hypothetical protein NKI36_14170 [Mesorhizobium caraganae]|uniref:Uncharacterized protein n=1 Tax=Mesorhizobium caraganae TaxID=483206 RepID=A0ABV1YZL9_9HYPH